MVTASMANLVRIHARALVPLAPLFLVGCMLEEPARPPAVWMVRPQPVVQPAPKPEEDIVYLRGEFSVPGRYVFTPPVHVVQAIDAAGGLTLLADPRVVVSRRLDDGRLVRWVVPTDQVHAGWVQDPELLAEDTIDAIGVHW